MRVRSAEEAQKAAEQLGYPVVVKRVDSSGSRGITVVEHSGQIEEAYEMRETVRQEIMCWLKIPPRNGNRRRWICAEPQTGLSGTAHEICIPRGAHTTVPVGHAFRMDAAGTAGRNCPPDAALAVASGADQSVPVNADVPCGRREGLIIEMGGRTGATYSGTDFNVLRIWFL